VGGEEGAEGKEEGPERKGHRKREGASPLPPSSHTYAFDIRVSHCVMRVKPAVEIVNILATSVAFPPMF
jgi:hypothetical protein